jgi:two-component system cell cycle response regulator DivK
VARISNPQENDIGPTSQPRNGKTILLAEDDPFISRMYQTKLTSAGFNVVWVNNGRDAFEQIKSIAPDLVMLDVMMPELTGFQVVAALKADGLLIASKVMMLTNSASPKDRQQAADLGVDYLIKSDLTPREVLDHINKKLGV